jgi:hypothetical protein
MPSTSSAGEHRFRVFRTPAGIEFSPPRESDALFDALRVAYPDGKSHFERVLSAVGDFVRGEGRDSAIATTPLSSHCEAAENAEKSLSCSRGKEDVTECDEEFKQHAEKRRGPSANDGRFKSMTNVWSTETGRRYQYRPRRPMTEEERAEYRNKRAVGVCAPCKKRKRKVRSLTFL